jgi:hypothetical protein
MQCQNYPQYTNFLQGKDNKQKLLTLLVTAKTLSNLMPAFWILNEVPSQHCQVAIQWCSSCPLPTVDIELFDDNSVGRLLITFRGKLPESLPLYS